MQGTIIIFILVILTGMFTMYNIIDRYRAKRWTSNFHKHSDFFLFVLWAVLIVVSLVLLIKSVDL